MAGVEEITKRKADISSNGINREIFFQDGDQVIGVVVTKDGVQDNRLQDYWQHVMELSPKKWEYTFCKESAGQECVDCDGGVPRRRRFGFWIYAYYSLHNKPLDRVETKEVRVLGKILYQRDINDFRIINMPFGRNDSFWNRFTSVYYENDSNFNTSVIRVTKTGEGIKTDWGVSQTKSTVDLTEEQWEEAKKLPGIVDYFMEREEQRQVAKGVPIDEIPTLDLGSDGDDDITKSLF